MTNRGSPAHELVEAPRGRVEIASTPSGARGWVESGRLREVATYVAAVAFFGLVIVLRRPDAVLRPGFFADDGPIYTNALAGGSILEPYGGYLIVPQRAIMAVAALLPPAQAPLFTNLVCIAIAAVVAGLIAFRLRQPLLALAFVLLPGSLNVLGTLPNIQWVLGVYLLVVVAEPRRGDTIPVALVALQGPIALVLAPLFVVRWWFRRDTWPILTAVIIGSVIQVAVLLEGARVVSGEYSELLMDVAWRGIVVPLIGVHLSPHVLPIVAVPIAALLIWTAWRLGWTGLALAYVWGAFMVGGTLLSPYPSHTIWTNLLLTERHFYLVAAAIAAVVVLGVLRRTPAALVLAPLLVLAMVADFRLPALNPAWGASSACVKGPIACTVPLLAGTPKWDVRWVPSP